MWSIFCPDEPTIQNPNQDLVRSMSRSTIFSFLRRINEVCFKRHPLLTNVSLSCCLAGTSDYIAQKFVQGHQTLDTQRTQHMVTYACTTAPLWHLWYKLVDHLIKPSRTWLKVVLDQTTVTPLDYIGFFAVFNYVKGDTIEECISELNRVYFKALIPDTMFWPLVSFIGYKWVPLHYRFVYFQFLELVWDIFLSNLKYSGKDPVKHTEISTIERPLLAGKWND
jgi:hypothetical protein